MYPPIEPFNFGHLEVSSVHKIYYEQCGNKNGLPVAYVHGGPGAGCTPYDRQYFDPEAYHIILFDQRGAGKSTPACCLDGNDTWSLVADMERLRVHLGVDRWMLFGGSWGVALSFSTWEMATSALKVDPENLSRCENDVWALAFARIECHYLVNKGFLKPNQLINDAHIIRNAKIPVTIVKGRYDILCPPKTAWDLYKQLPEADLFFVDDAGHSSREPGIRKRLLEACDKYKTLTSSK